MSGQVFEHVKEQAQAFHEIFRVLKPGGVNINVIPAKWKFIEPQIYVPLGGFEPFKFYAYINFGHCLAHATGGSEVSQ
jgi:hypothetical protein